VNGTLLPEEVLQNAYVKIPSFNLVAADVDEQTKTALMINPLILSIDEDSMLELNLFDEDMPWGIRAIQGDSTIIPHDFVNNCDDSDAFKIGIIDTGIWAMHTDGPCMGNNTCAGSSFNIPTGQYWYNPIISHGTHVAGIIAARLNNYGLVGVLGDGNVCIIMARIFDDSGNGASTSSAIQAIHYLTNLGAKVINMSFGGPTYVQAFADIVLQSYAQGTIFIGSGGNSGDATLNYPSNYDKVLGVAAIDDNYVAASFSTYNAGIDIAAPGVSILSLVPPGEKNFSFYFLNTGETSFELFSLNAMNQTPMGQLIFCPSDGGLCGSHNNSRFICLLRDVDISLEQLALNCQNVGGVAAIIFGDNNGYELPLQSPVQIPVYYSKNAIGQLSGLLNHTGQHVCLKRQTNYWGYKSGTSMAAPHVTGAVGALYRTCQTCEPDVIVNCVLSTALDLGDAGWDVHYGFGLIQMENAYLCLNASKWNASQSPMTETPSASPTEC
jgi:subtilisin family serine protease